MRKFLLTTQLDNLVNKFDKLMGDILAPILIVIGAAAAIYCVYLGVMYAKAEDANKRKEVQGRLIGAAIGVVIIIVGVTLCYALNWEKIVTSFVKDYKNEAKNPITSISRLFR